MTALDLPVGPAIGPPPGPPPAGTAEPPAPDTERGLREQLSSLQGLLALSMVMTDRGNEPDILHVATTAVPSLAGCRMEGVYLLDAGWRATTGAGSRHEVRADVQAQLAGLHGGGAVTIRGVGWGWAFPLRSSEGHFGHFVVSADAEPTPAQVFLLRVLAQQTCIALANARLHARERASAEQLRSANCKLAGTVEALERKTAIHDRLTRVAIACEGHDGIAAAVHELTGFAVAVEDRHGNLLAWAGPDQPARNGKASPASRERVLARALREARPIRANGRLLAVAKPREDVLGVLALIDPKGLAGEQEQVALEHGATVLAVELSRLQGLAETELRLGQDTVAELIAGTNTDGALARARALGYDLERPHRVVVVEGHCPRRAAADGFFDVVRRMARSTTTRALLLARDGVVVVLSPAEPDDGAVWERFRATVLAELGGGRCRVGVSGICRRPTDFPRAHREAQLALRLHDVASGIDRAVVYDRLGVYQLLAEVEDPAAVERHARQWLGPLLDYDARRHSELVATLSRYLESGGSYDGTAHALAIGRSTLKYRLRRIREISGHDLANADTRFNLQLATRGWRTVGALRG